MTLDAFHKKTVGILGAARSGLALAKALADAGAKPVFWDDGDAGRTKAQANGFAVADMTQPKFWQDTPADMLVVSPGIPHLYPTMHPAIAQAIKAGVPVDNDISLYLQGTRNQTIAITGSNGKSTTSALIHHLLQQAGKSCALGGNIGNAVFNLPATDHTVIELSSYQTDLASCLRTSCAVFLNLSDDHLDRHNGRGGYFAAKERLIAQTAHAVIGIDEPEGLFLANRYAAKATLMSAKPIRTTRPAVFMDGETLTVWDGTHATHTFTLDQANSLRGAHNRQNACASVAIALHLGLMPEAIQTGLNSFTSLPHRMEEVAVINGVRFINDSKATNTDAAQKALSSFDNIRWIAGGKAKDGGIAELLPWLDHVHKTYLIGDAAESFAQTLANRETTLSHTLEQAVKDAFADARAGDVVLLSPACASFDQFTSFEHRGDVFRTAVEALAKF